jgi:hypothetical protein
LDWITYSHYWNINGFNWIILNKKTGLFSVDDGLMTITTELIEINSTKYLYKDISRLEFHFHSYYSQSSFGFFTENAGYIEVGMGNYVRFVFKKEKIEERFFLGNQLQAEMFLQMVNELKNSNISYDITYRNLR